jgi:hypothetical protein
VIVLLTLCSYVCVCVFVRLSWPSSVLRATASRLNAAMHFRLLSTKNGDIHFKHVCSDVHAESRGGGRPYANQFATFRIVQIYGPSDHVPAPCKISIPTGTP